MLSGKTVLLGVTGGIACYKAAELASLLVKQHCNVRVLMTQNATEFIAPLTFESLTGNRVAVETFDRNRQWEIEHITLADQVDLVLIAPATANILAKLAHGLADDMLTTTVLACDCPKLAAPAMNTRMYENPVTQDNLQTLRRYGWEIIEPANGRLACGTIGKGKLPDPDHLLEPVLHALSYQKDMTGLKVLVTAGPTREALDPVRYLTNHSTGRMGYAVARAAAARGADVTLVTGPTELRRPPYMVEVVEVTTAREMFEAVTSRSGEMDMVVKSAAVADYRPRTVAEEKIKKAETEENLSLPLERTDDILAWLGAHKRAGQVLCGFSMETTDMLEHSRRKLEKKQVDMIAANNLREEGAGFGTPTNLLTLITVGEVTPLQLMSKTEAAHKILDEMLRLKKV